MGSHPPVMGNWPPIPSLPIGGGGKPPPENKPPPEEGGEQKPPPPSGEQKPGPKPPGEKPTPPSGGEQPSPAPPSSGSEEGNGNGESGEGSGGCIPCQPNDTATDDPKPAGPGHPLNQLDQNEITSAVNLIKSRAQNEGITQELVFSSVSMKEPPKSQLLPYILGEEGAITPPRKAWSVFSPDGVNTAYEAVVNLDSGEVEEFTMLPPGTQPSVNIDEPLLYQDVVRKDPRVIERAARAGVTNTDFLMCDVWSYGYNDTPEDQQNKRLFDVYFYASNYEGDNQYAHPLDFHVTVDAIEKRVIEIVDLPVCPVPGSPNEEQPQSRPVPPPPESHNYDPRVLPDSFFRKDVKPLNITQKEGPSFTINGNTINWQRWELIVGFNFREGLTLHNISFTYDGVKRTVLYRASISEMVVPYGDPRIPFYRKSAFDLGEYGLGYNANSLTNGCDCLGEIRYMDFVYADSKGEPKVTRNAVCIHEEDYGILQKHTEFRNGNVTVARSRRLVVSFIATVANYDYLYYWMFYQDGTIEMDIKASGLLSTHQLGIGECGTGGFGTIMAPRLFAPVHQHIFCARLDTMIDGLNNSVAIQELQPMSQPKGSQENPFGNGFQPSLRILETAAESGTDTEPDLTRSWIITNESSINPRSQTPVGWKLVAPGYSRILTSPEGGIYKRAGFARHNVWVTPFNDEQLYASGKFINQAPGDRDGVAVWAERDNGVIRNTDIVLWHTFGLNHITRTEDFSLMPVEGTSFIFRPCNFFLQNPALDVPAPKRKNCKGQD